MSRTNREEPLETGLEPPGFIHGEAQAGRFVITHGFAFLYKVLVRSIEQTKKCAQRGISALQLQGFSGPQLHRGHLFYERKNMENIKESLEGLISAMQKAGIVYIAADYGGYGDSWDGMGFITAVAIDGNEKVACPLSVQSAAEDFVVEVVNTYHADFENDDGGRGTVTVDLLAREVRIEHIYLGVESAEYLITAEEDEDLAALLQEHAPVEINERSRYARMRFEGYGDSGQMEECDPAARPFEDWGYTVLENKRPGWEINEGGGAEFLIDFQERRVRALIWSNMEVDGDPIVHTLSFDEVLRASSGEGEAA